ncbi:hypothetical protein TD95_004150 [Thielaviopsis punctulata]|uniref:Uncharacterized protein n=1 Tax=Thielaviopsis punctulata TaxID=72032 RepID=A0A0F4ZEQ8_9PEZI|nr:hypothetical protein TD95_004150 [Thielaviopsis punctulata]
MIAPAIPTSDDCKRRLIRLQKDWLVEISQLPDLGRPSQLHVPSFRVPEDDARAESLLRRRQLETSASAKKDSSLKRAFTSRKKGWQVTELLDALDAHVAAGGTPGVAEVLVNRLVGYGAGINELPLDKRSSFIGRRKSDCFGFAERTKILHKAIEQQSIDTLRVLLPHADAASLDSAVSSAAIMLDCQSVELLMRYGADPFRDPQGQDAFRQLCTAGGHSDLVQWMVAGGRGASSNSLSQGMVDAVKSGCLQTVICISQSMADCNYNSAEALMAAIELGRRDMVLVLACARNPPKSPNLERALDTLFGPVQVHPTEKLCIAEVLLCAGAKGDSVSRALKQAASSQFIEMVRVLVRYGASIQYENGAVVKDAVSKGYDGLLEALLYMGSPLSPQIASACVPLIPPHVTPDSRHSLLTMLLHKGASGDCLNEALVQAVRDSDDKTAALLVRPRFLEAGSPNSSKSSIKRRPTLNSHAIASLDYKGGEAIKQALIAGDIPMLVLLLSGGPSTETLVQTFPLTHRMPRELRLEAVECFLAAGLPVTVAEAEFKREIEQPSGHRDDQLIAIMLNYASKGNFDGGSAVVTAISRHDRGLLATVLQHSTPLAAAEGIPVAVAIADEGMRREMVGLLLQAGADTGKPYIVAAVMSVLKAEPVDVKLLRLLLTRGHADMNASGGAPLLCVPKADLGRFLPEEIHQYVHMPKSERSTAIIQALLKAGADINSPGGLSLALAVSAANMPLTDMLLAENPGPETVAHAFRQAINLPDPMNRLTFAERLLKTSILPTEVDQALLYSIKKYPEDLGLLKLLLTKADVSSGESLYYSVTSLNAGIVRLLLTSKHPESVVDEAFRKALACESKQERFEMVEAILAAGVTPPVLHELFPVAAAQGDLDLVNLLVSKGASLDDLGGQAVIQAVRSGSPQMLKMLLSKSENSRYNNPAILNAAFTAATEVVDFERQGAVVELLMECGVNQELVNAQLIAAAHHRNKGVGLVKILLAHGADPSFQSGEAVCVAAKSACSRTLELLLGRSKAGPKQKIPKTEALMAAFDSCWKLSRETRMQFFGWLFDAGLPLCSAVHLALQRAVIPDDGKEPDIDLIKLLLRHGALATYEDCTSLIRATSIPSSELLNLLLGPGISSRDSATVFEASFRPENISKWFNEEGYQCAEKLLGLGANREALGMALVACLEASTANYELADRFFNLLINHDCNVNYSNSKALCLAVSHGNITWTRKLASIRPSSSSISAAIELLFDGSLDENSVTETLHLLLNGTNEVDSAASPENGKIPVLARAIMRFPRSVEITSMLLEAGYYCDPFIPACISNEENDLEQVNLLTWAIVQPEKRISSAIIEKLVVAGAATNFETPQMQLTPLMLAVRERRQDVVKTLLLSGADIDSVDAFGTSALLMASLIPGPLAADIMSILLLADPAKNDGSLHTAARQVNLETMRLLLDHGHDPDFPSQAHDGRSALGELCLHACDEGSPAPVPARQREMEKAIAVLIKHGSDLRIKALGEGSDSGKTVAHLAMDSAAPVVMLQVLLKAGMWKHINETFTHYTVNGHTYSLTMYVRQVRRRDEHTDRLITLLRNNRATDVYFCVDGPQPDGAVGLPDEIAASERLRTARLKQLHMAREDQLQRLAHQREIAAVDAQLWQDKTAREYQHRLKLQQAESQLQQERQAAEMQHFKAMLDAKTAAQRNEREHMAALDKASAARVGREIEAEERRQRRALEHESQLAAERVANQRAVSQVQYERQQAMARLDREAAERDMARIRAHKQLIQDQSALAGQLSDARTMAIGGRQPMGYVTDIHG